MTAEVIKYIKSNAGIFSHAKVMADGHLINIEEIRIGNKINALVYVDGVTSFKYCFDSHEFMKYMYKTEKHLWSAKERKEHKRLGTGFVKKKYATYSPFYPSLNAVIQRLKKSCTEVTIYKEPAEVDSTDNKIEELDTPF